jgi:hypothetical protein
MKIKTIPFSASNFFADAVEKKQIYLHHTAGNYNGELVYKGWANNQERIATCVVISGKGASAIDGEIIQGYKSEYWAYHLGVKKEVFGQIGVPYVSLDKISIGIEICNWGQLTIKDGKYYNYVNKEVPASEVCQLETEYKGHKYFHAYTDAQIESVRQLLIHFKDKYSIPLTYNEDIWGVTMRAFKGEAGVYTHNSVRKDKIDIAPQPKIVEMLKNLK